MKTTKELKEHHEKLKNLLISKCVGAYIDNAICTQLAEKVVSKIIKDDPSRDKMLEEARPFVGMLTQIKNRRPITRTQLTKSISELETHLIILSSTYNPFVRKFITNYTFPKESLFQNGMRTKFLFDVFKELIENEYI